MPKDDSTVRIELGLRAAHLAKVCLEMLSLSPQLARLQLHQIAQELKDVDEFLKKNGV